MIKQKTLLLLGLFLCFNVNAQYDISVEVNGLTCDDELLLAYHYGDKQLLKDTSICQEGVFHFRGEETLKTGIYLIVLPKKSYIEILISDKEDQTKYVFRSDTSLKSTLTFAEGSKENELFFEQNRFASSQSVKATALKKKYDAEENEKIKAKLEIELRALGREVHSRRQEVVNNNNGLFVSTLYRSMDEVVIIDAPTEYDKEEARMFKYMWIRQHYWDNVDLGEDGLMRSPIFHNKLKAFMDSYIPRDVDTAIFIVDNMIERIVAGGSREQYKYSLHFILKHFEKSNTICFDKGVWHIAKNYYCAGKAPWADSSYVAMTCKVSAEMESTLCEKTAPDMNMPDTTFTKRSRLYDIDKPVTILIFWDIDCGHCKKEMPVLSHAYDSMTNEYFEIYAVYTKDDWEGWRKRMADEKFKFINVANSKGDDNYRKLYGFKSVPEIYVLDKDKKIRYKKVAAHDIPRIVQHLLEEQGIIEPKEEAE